MKITAKAIAFTALLSAIICALSPWTIPVGIIPISLASFGVYLASGVIDFRYGSPATFAYVLIGGIGLPVFSGGKGGFGVIAGPTGGYIIGYIFLALIAGLIIDLFGKSTRIWVYPLAFIAGTAVLYALGTGWYIVSTGADIVTALGVCVLPFLIGDSIKITVATVVAFPVRRAVSGMLQSRHAERREKPDKDMKA